jgi:WD40 repeat protein
MDGLQKDMEEKRNILNNKKKMDLMYTQFVFLFMYSNKPTDGLIYTYDQHEDSVYKVAWSPADTWTFASISYAGRVVISQVPTNEKFKILGV